MKVIIIGGAGLFGNALAKDLIQENPQVIALTRNPESVKSIPMGMHLVKWDGCTTLGWGNLVDGADAIVNLVGENLPAGRWTSDHKKRILESRVNAGKAIVQAVDEAVNKPGVVIQSSAVGYYGMHKPKSLTEAAPVGDDFLAQVCQVWEASSKPVEALGVRRCVIRSAVFLSPKAGVLPRFLLPFRFFVGDQLGSGNQWLPWIHLLDATRAIRFLIDHDNCRGAYNLISPGQVTNRQFVKALGRVMHRASIIPVPAFALRLLFGVMSVMVLEGQNLSVDRLLQSGFTFQFPEIETALRDLIRK